MGKQRVKPSYHRRSLRLPDLDHCKRAVLSSLDSAASRRVYEYAIDQFIAWYCSEPRLAFNRIVVMRYRLYSRTGSPSFLPLSISCARNLPTTTAIFSVFVGRLPVGQLWIAFSSALIFLGSWGIVLLILFGERENRYSHYIIQHEERLGAGGCTWHPLRRQEIKSNRVATLSPELSISIICSKLNPACSPAIASLLTAVTNVGFSTVASPRNCRENRIGPSSGL
jgi:hypothetical protein